MGAPKLAFVLACVSAAGVLMAATGYQSEIAEWRRQREAGLRRDGGWLTVTGLFWLREGANRFGAAAGNEVVLPSGPAQAGIFELQKGKVIAKVNGSSRELRPDSEDLVQAGRLRLYVIQRGDRFGIRLKDPDSQFLREFHGLEYFPAREEYRVTARFVAEARKIPIANIVGQTELDDSPGYVVFQLQGREFRLYPVLEEPGAKELFFIFRDETAGRETYGAGRFLYTDLPKNGTVVLDFNKAYNPPCAFTPFATCPLPPKENRIGARIEAGEKKYGH
ncbi:MAG TPA: DUF1684 domain-containing protein [Bryobacteraceae bacterium]|nr:DUF1684 domain-containing protein [Bryobacteraceae bacterium]